MVVTEKLFASTTKIEIPKTKHSEQLKTDIERAVTDFQKRKNRPYFYAQITALTERAKQLQLTPQQLTDNVDISCWIATLVPELGGFAPTRAGHTIYNCGRPDASHLTPQQLSRISKLTQELLTYHQSTADHPPLTLAPDRLSWNPAIRQEQDPDVPDVFETILSDCVHFIADEKLTDDYSLRQAILMLLAVRKLNVEPYSYAIVDNQKASDTTQWITSLATAIVRKETSCNAIIEQIGTQGWEYKIHSFLIQKWDLPKETDIATQLQTLHPSIDPKTSLSFLKEKSQLDIPSLPYTDYQLALLSGIEVCIKSELTRFILDFTAGATGRLKNSEGHNRQCGSEYSNQAINAMTQHEKDPNTPKSISEWIPRQLYHLRYDLMRDHFVPVGEQRLETYFFNQIMDFIESAKNPNTDLRDFSVNEHTGDSIQTALVTKLTVKKCVEHLSTMIAQNLSQLAQLTTTDDEKKHLIQLSRSEAAICQALINLKLIRPNDRLSGDPSTQEKQVQCLVYSIFILSPTTFIPLMDNIQSQRHVLHDETMTAIRQRLLHSITEKTNLCPSVQTFLSQTLEDKVIENGIVSCLENGPLPQKKQAISILFHFLTTTSNYSDILDNDRLIQTLITLYPTLSDSECKDKIAAIFNRLSSDPKLRVALSETGGLMELLDQHQQPYRIVWLECARNLLQDPQTHYRFAEFPTLVSSLIETIPPETTLSLITHPAFGTLLVDVFVRSLNWLFHGLAFHKDGCQTYCTLVTTLANNPDCHDLLIDNLLYGLSQNSTECPLPVAFVDVLLSLNSSSEYLKRITQFEVVQRSPKAVQATIELFNSTDNPLDQHNALQALANISAHPKSLLNLMNELPRLIEMFATHQKHHRALSHIFFYMSRHICVADQDQNLNNVADLDGQRALEIFHLNTIYSSWCRDFRRFVTSDMAQSPDLFARDLIQIAKFNVTERPNRFQSTISAVYPIDVQSLETIRQSASLSIRTLDRPESYAQYIEHLNAQFKEVIKPVSINEYSQESEYGLFVITNGKNVPLEFQSELGRIVLRWKKYQDPRLSKKQLFPILNAFSVTSSIVSYELLSTCLNIMGQSQTNMSLFEAASQTFEICVEQLPLDQKHNTSLLVQNFELLNQLYSNGSMSNSLMCRLIEIPEFAHQAHRSERYMSSLIQNVCVPPTDNLDQAQLLGTTLLNILKHGNNTLALPLRIQLLNSLLSNFDTITECYPKQLILSLLAVITDHPDMTVCLQESLSNDESHPKIQYIIDGLFDDETKEFTVSLLKHMTMPESRLLRNRLDAVPFFVLNVLPLLNEPEHSEHFARVIAEAVVNNPVAQRSLKTDRIITQLLELNAQQPTERTIEHTENLYTILKFALGVKRLGQWSKDLSPRVQTTLATQTNRQYAAILRQTIAPEGSALAKLLL